jgi:hypothetical protein
VKILHNIANILKKLRAESLTFGEKNSII